MIRALIADDDHLMRAGLAELLTADRDIDVIGQASTGREAIAQARRLGPDVILMDVRMPDLDGISRNTYNALLCNDFAGRDDHHNNA